MASEVLLMTSVCVRVAFFMFIALRFERTQSSIVSSFHTLPIYR